MALQREAVHIGMDDVELLACSEHNAPSHSGEHFFIGCLLSVVRNADMSVTSPADVHGGGANRTHQKTRRLQLEVFPQGAFVADD